MLERHEADALLAAIEDGDVAAEEGVAEEHFDAGELFGADAGAVKGLISIARDHVLQVRARRSEIERSDAPSAPGAETAGAGLAGNGLAGAELVATAGVTRERRDLVE